MESVSEERISLEVMIVCLDERRRIYARRNRSQTGICKMHVIEDHEATNQCSLRSAGGFACESPQKACESLCQRRNGDSDSIGFELRLMRHERGTRSVYCSIC